MRQFSIKQLLIAVLVVACICAFAASFGPHMFWASTHIATPKYVALTRVNSVVKARNEVFIECQFENLIFSLPESLARDPKIVRSSVKDVYLAFSDSERFLQIPLHSNMREIVEPVPPSLDEKTVPKLVENIATTSSNDFSYSLTRDQLAVHDWAIAKRKTFDFELQSMDRFSTHYGNTVDVITISVAPITNASKGRVRSILIWESLQGKEIGSIWFGDASKSHVDWIDDVAQSIDVATSQPQKANPNRDYAAMTDAELLALLQTHSPISNKE